MKRISFDEKVEQYLNEQIIRLKELGIKNISKPDALRFIIEQNRAVQLKIKKKRGRGSRFKFIFQ